MKITMRDNYRVVIRPAESSRRPVGRTNEEEEHYHKHIAAECKQILDDVIRHVDNVETVDIEWDSTDRCNFCERIWEADERLREPFCCDAAIEEWEAEEQ